MPGIITLLFPLVLLAMMACTHFTPEQEPTEAADPVTLPGGWKLQPAGISMALGSFPENLARHPGGHWLAVMHGGLGEHTVSIIDLKSYVVVDQKELPHSFYGLTFDRAGDHLYVSGGEDGLVARFGFAAGKLVEQSPCPLGVKLAPKRTEKHAAQKVKEQKRGEEVLVGGLALDEDAGYLYAALTFGDALVRSPLKGKGQPERLQFDKESFPYALLLDKARHRLFVSLWGKGAIAVVDLPSFQLAARWGVGSHPTEMLLSPDGGRLYVASSNTTGVDILDTASGKVDERLNAALYAEAPVGNTPSSIALTEDGEMLLVANSAANNLALFNVKTPTKAVPLGFIPTGWYPTVVRWDQASRRIFVANGKGGGSLPNPKAPGPLEPRNKDTYAQYIGLLIKGSLNIIDFPDPRRMQAYTRSAFTLSPLRADQSVVVRGGAERGSPIPDKVGGSSPIKHVVYIIKENRTYDQVLGDLPEGNGDAKLCLFPEKVTPNHHALAREFVLLDNFYADGEISATGHEWSMAAYATDFVEKMWPLNYRGSTVVSYPAEGTYDAIARSAGGYLWNRALKHNVSFINLGEWTTNGDKPSDPATPSVPELAGHIDPLYRNFDLRYADVDRAKRFGQDLATWEGKNEMPQLVIIRLPNDHTAGARAGFHTPEALLADNDLALGQIIEAISHSTFWKDTVVFVVEDDAQNGPDHVDAHRTVALVVSPWTKRRALDHSMYSTTSLLRTMELILGFEPMSQFDAAATPMYNSFQATPDLTPYQHCEPGSNRNAMNPATGPGADRSAAMDFSKEDQNDDISFNEVIWRAVRGADAVMPAPIHAAFYVPHVKSHGDEDGDGD